MLELFLLLLLGLPAANADPKVDLGDPPTFTGTQVTEADEAQTAHAGGCEARLGTGGPVQWRFVPTTCADGERSPGTAGCAGTGYADGQDVRQRSPRRHVGGRRRRARCGSAGTRRGSHGACAGTRRDTPGHCGGFAGTRRDFLGPCLGCSAGSSDAGACSSRGSGSGNRTLHGCPSCCRCTGTGRTGSVVGSRGDAVGSHERDRGVGGLACRRRCRRARADSSRSPAPAGGRTSSGR